MNRVVVVLAVMISCVILAVAHWPSRFPGSGDWPRGTPSEFGMNEMKLTQARDIALKCGGSEVVIHRGKLVYSWGDQKARYDLKSTTKSIGAAALGLALMDHKIRLDEPASKYCPAVMTPVKPDQAAWMKSITFFELA